jgi:hypothetical protein
VSPPGEVNFYEIDLGQLLPFAFPPAGTAKYIDSGGLLPLETGLDPGENPAGSKKGRHSPGENPRKTTFFLRLDRVLSWMAPRSICYGDSRG